METKKIVAIGILVFVGSLIAFSIFGKSKKEKYNAPDTESKLEWVLKEDIKKMPSYTENGEYTYRSFDQVELDLLFHKPDFKRVFEFRIGTSPVQTIEVKSIYKDIENGFPKRVIYYKGRGTENIAQDKAMIYQAYFLQPIKSKEDFEAMDKKIAVDLALKDAQKDYNNVQIVLEDKSGNKLISESVEGKLKPLTNP